VRFWIKCGEFASAARSWQVGELASGIGRLKFHSFVGRRCQWMIAADYVGVTKDTQSQRNPPRHGKIRPTG
jgi:hypothetical protein